MAPRTTARTQARRRAKAPRVVSALPHHTPIAVGRREACQAPFVDGDVVHDHAGIGLYLAGSTRMWLSHDYALGRGDLLLIPEGMPHATRSSEGGSLWGVMLCTSCMRGSWGEALREALEHVRAGRSAVRRLADHDLPHAELLLQALERELSAMRPAQALMVDGLMAQLVALIVRAGEALQPADTQAEPAPRLVTDALGYVERHGARGISLSDVAKALGRSPTHVASLVKLHTGRTVVAWITHARMVRARELLRASDASIDQIAEQVGFGSASHFHRTFRKHHDVSPSAWRAAHGR